MKWYDVKDKLPKAATVSDIELLFLITDGEVIDIGCYEGKDEEDSPVWTTDGIRIECDDYGFPNVKHWMPMPALPETKK